MSYTFLHATPNTLVVKDVHQQRVATCRWTEPQKPLYYREQKSGLQWYGIRHFDGSRQISIGNDQDDILWSETVSAEVHFTIHEVFEDSITAIYFSDAEVQVQTRDFQGNILRQSRRPQLPRPLRCA